MKRILMIAADDNRWGPARLPEPLTHAGIDVAVLSGAENPLNHSSFAKRHYSLAKLQSWRSFGKALGSAMADWKPDLIVACDELVIAMLHYLLKNPRAAKRFLNVDQISILKFSTGKSEMLDSMVLKHSTRVLAESLGVRVPKTQLVTSLAQAQDVAAQFGFPVFLKQSFSWAGAGALACHNPDQLQAAFSKLHSTPSRLKNLCKRIMARDWYPTESELEIQHAIAGSSAMYSVAALNGKILSGFFATRAAKLSENGPSTKVAMAENIECRQMAEKMVAAMGASGFLAFDFMKCATTDKFYLLECNPRPNQICHLGYHVGTDLCQALADSLNGLPQLASAKHRDAVATLFPQAWLHDEQSAFVKNQKLDIPKNDPELLDFMLGRGQTKGHGIGRLLDFLKGQGLIGRDYTFG